MDNEEIITVIYSIADLLDIKGEDFFKTRAYRLAAQALETLDEDITVLVEEERIQEIQGIGKAIAQKITELVQTGKLTYYEELKKEVPESLLKILQIPGLGPKKVAAMYHKLGLTTVDEVQQAAEQGNLRELEGFGEITERNILRGIQLRRQTSGRFLLHRAYDDAMKYLEYMKKCTAIKQVNIAGSLRRMKETIGDLDILASSTQPENVMTYFTKYQDIDRVLLQGNTKTSVLLYDNVQVDLRVVEPKSYGAALQYFTGSKEHNVALRGLAIKQGYKLNEYGLFQKDNEKYVCGKDEHELYDKLGLAYIEPELRENRGEIEAASSHALRSLVSMEDIKGDFHVHSQWSDGFDTLEDMVEQAKTLGYEYIGSTDHSQTLQIAHGLSEERVKKKQKAIEKMNKKHSDFTVLFSTECDIKADGTLDYPDSILKLFDIVYIGVHSGFKMDEKDMTKRLISGMSNEHAHILAHPTGRMIGRRESVNLDMQQIFDAAKDTHTCLEINAFPDRLDLNDIMAKQAKDREVTLAIGTDSHSIDHLQYMKFGVATARRGWIEPKDILNTLSVKDIMKIIKG